MIAVLIVSIIVLLAIAIRRSLAIPRGLRSVPGPKGVPLIGYLPFMSRKVHLTLTDLWRRYGDVYQIKLGCRRLVILNGHDTIRRAFADKSFDFGGRPDFYTYKIASRDNLIGMNDYSEQYKIAKKTLVKAFGNFHAEKKHLLQEASHRSVGHLIDLVKGANNQPFDPTPHFYPIVCTIVGYVCWGEFFDVKDHRVQHILKNANEFGTAMAFGVLCDYLPCLKTIFDKKLKKFETMLATSRAYTKKLSAEHVTTYNGKDLRDITDFFHKVADEMPEHKKKSLNLCHKKLLSISGGLFGAGFATIAVTIKWAMILLAKHPEFQVKMQEELDRVIGKDKYPVFSDIESLPYTMAVIYELYRYSSVAHIGFAHKTMCDTEIDGHSLPQGTTIVANFYSAHRDPKYFKDPHAFNPERFLISDRARDENWDENRNGMRDENLDDNQDDKSHYRLNKALTEKVIAYGLGIRRCGGEIVAKLEIFTFISALFHRCRVERISRSPDRFTKLQNYGSARPQSVQSDRKVEVQRVVNVDGV